MKRYAKILLYAAALVAAAGCEMSDVDYLPNGGERAIAYSSSVEATRATETDQGAFETPDNKFEVAAFLDDNSHYFTEEVTYSGDVWTSGITRYWPVASGLDMFAYSPVGDSFIVLEGSDSYDDLALSYTCPSEAAEQVDLLVSKLEVPAPNSSVSSGAAEMLFKHALSAVKFNVKVESEKNVTLNNITVNYKNIVKSGVYDLKSESWETPESPIYFGTSEDQTIIGVNGEANLVGGIVDFGDVEQQVMIIPQAIDHSRTDPHYLSIAISYTLKSGTGDGIYVTTGVMPLPVTTLEGVVQNAYLQGRTYTYNIVVNGETILFEDISIEDQDDPVGAYGNMDLRLITSEVSYYTYEENVKNFFSIDKLEAPDDIEEGIHYYYASAERVARLLNDDDDVRDFVVLGSVENNTKLGHYGSTSSPFYIAANSLGMMPDYTIDTSEGYDNMIFEEVNPAYLFSIDMRGVYGFDLFKDVHDTSAMGGNILPDDATVLTEGLFKDLPLLDEILLPHGLSAIGHVAFQNCISLKSIDLADVVHVEEGGFVDCKSLEVVYKGHLIRVHKNGFDSCTSLTTIDLSNLEVADELAFVNCVSLTNVDLGSLTTIGGFAFNNCSSLTLQENTSIPAFENVAEFAFSGCSALGTNGGVIDLSTKGLTVGDFAFNGCGNIRLSSGDLSTLTTIGNHAFDWCGSLGLDSDGNAQEITLRDVTSIGMYAFRSCVNANVVSGLSHLDKISSGAFQGASKFTGYSSAAAVEDRYLSLPLVDSVGISGFSESGIVDVRFSKDGKGAESELTRVYDDAFYNCDDLVSVSGLDNVVQSGKNAFANCDKLEELRLPALTSDLCAGGLFANSTAIKVLSLPQLVNNDTYVYDENGDESATTFINMVNDLRGLVTLDMPALVAEIGAWGDGFQNMDKLQTVNLNEVTRVENGAFQNCKALVNLNLSETLHVGTYAFQHCDALEELILPSVTSFEYDFVNQCSALTKLAMRDLKVMYSADDTQQYIFNMIKNNTTIKTLILPSLTGSIGSFEGGWGGIFCYYDAGVLQNDMQLESVNLSSIESLGNYTFHGCTTLKYVDLSGVTTTGVQPFYECSGIVKLNLSGLVDDANITTADGGLFGGFTNSENCEIWLSSAQGAQANLTTNQWQNKTWLKIHVAEADGTFDEEFKIE